MFLSINRGAVQRGEYGIEEFEHEVSEFDSFDAWLEAYEAYSDRVHLAIWRKANGILNWFDHNLESVKNQEKVDNPDRDGVWNCKLYPVTKAECEKLLEDCTRVWKTKEIPNDLQRTNGFFFGSQKIDDLYWEDIDYTVDVLTEKLDTIDWDSDRVYFHISY